MAGVKEDVGIASVRYAGYDIFGSMGGSVGLWYTLSKSMRSTWCEEHGGVRSNGRLCPCMWWYSVQAVLELF